MNHFDADPEGPPPENPLFKTTKSQEPKFVPSFAARSTTSVPSQPSRMAGAEVPKFVPSFIPFNPSQPSRAEAAAEPPRFVPSFAPSFVPSSTREKASAPKFAPSFSPPSSGFTPPASPEKKESEKIPDNPFEGLEPEVKPKPGIDLFKPFNFNPPPVANNPPSFVSAKPGNVPKPEGAGAPPKPTPRFVPYDGKISKSSGGFIPEYVPPKFQVKREAFNPPSSAAAPGNYPGRPSAGRANVPGLNPVDLFKKFQAPRPGENFPVRDEGPAPPEEEGPNLAGDGPDGEGLGGESPNFRNNEEPLKRKIEELQAALNRSVDKMDSFRDKIFRYESEIDYLKQLNGLHNKQMAKTLETEKSLRDLVKIQAADIAALNMTVALLRKRESEKIPVFVAKPMIKPNDYLVIPPDFPDRIIKDSEITEKIRLQLQRFKETVGEQEPDINDVVKVPMASAKLSDSQILEFLRQQLSMFPPAAVRRSNRAKLGLPEGAQKDKIKEQYRSLAMMWHPDKYPNAPPAIQEQVNAQFSAYTAAYNALI